MNRFLTSILLISASVCCAATSGGDDDPTPTPNPNSVCPTGVGPILVRDFESVETIDELVKTSFQCNDTEIPLATSFSFSSAESESGGWKIEIGAQSKKGLLKALWGMDEHSNLTVSYITSIDTTVDAFVHETDCAPKSYLCGSVPDPIPKTSKRSCVYFYVTKRKQTEKGYEALYYYDPVTGKVMPEDNMSPCKPYYYGRATVTRPIGGSTAVSQYKYSNCCCGTSKIARNPFVMNKLIEYYTPSDDCTHDQIGRYRRTSGIDERDAFEMRGCPDDE